MNIPTYGYLICAVMCLDTGILINHGVWGMVRIENPDSRKFPYHITNS